MRTVVLCLNFSGVACVFCVLKTREIRRLLAIAAAGNAVLVNVLKTAD